MRIADRLLRQGHLSEQAVVAAVMGGDRPDHLDRCASCAERAFELGRWLDQTRNEAIAAADAACPPERLAVQHDQILRRIAQMEQPVRVIEFPRPHAAVPSNAPPRRVSPAWLGVAAAAGLAVGVVGGHFSAHLEQSTRPASAAATARSSDAAAADLSFGFVNSGSDSETEAGTTPATGLLDLDLDGTVPPWLQPLEENTPRLSQVAWN